MENVAGLLSAKHYQYFCRCIEELTDAGYVVQHRLLDAVSFGVPQFRLRVWVWDIRKDLYAAGMRHAWPHPTHEWPPPQGHGLFGASLPGVTVGQALNIRDGRGLELHVERTLPPGGFTTTPFNFGTGPDPEGFGDTEPHELFIRRMRGKGMLERGGDRRDHPTTEPSPAITVSKGGGGTPLFWHSEEPRQWHWSDALLAKQPPIELDAPAPTIVKNWAKGTPYGCLKWKQTPEGLWISRLHPLECARLQSVPDDFVWPEDLPKTHAYRIIGNGQASLMVLRLREAMETVDPESKTCIDLYCGGGIGATGFAGRAWSYDLETAGAA